MIAFTEPPRASLPPVGSSPKRARAQSSFLNTGAGEFVGPCDICHSSRMAAKALGLGGLLLAALLIGMKPATGATRSLRAPACRIWQLAISSGPEISEKTGQHSLTIRLTNRGRAACLLDGYPTVGLRAARGRLPLQISHRGDTMIAGHRPRPVTVRAGGSAYV